MQKVTLNDLKEIRANCNKAIADARAEGDETLADVIVAWTEYLDARIQEEESAE